MKNPDSTRHEKNDGNSPFELDPFAFPQETNGRFHMLIAAAAILAWSLGGWWVDVPNIYAINWSAEPELQQHFERLKKSPKLENIDLESLTLFRNSKLFPQGMEYLSLQLKRIAISIGIVSVTGLLTLILYRLHPIIAVRRYRTSSLEAPTVTDEVARLASVAGLVPPRVAIKPGFLDGLAFGLRGRETLALGGKRSILARRWSPHTRAVALHEMAHIANGDIVTRTGSSSIWFALTTMIALIGVLVAGTSNLLLGRLQIPVFRLSFISPEVETFWGGSGVIVAFTGVLLLTVWWLWSELIRAREFYADARVATWGFRGPLLETLRLGDASAGKYRFARRHPSHASRIRSLRDSGKLFRASSRLSFLTGLLLTLMVGQMTSLSTDLTFITVAICTPLLFVLGPFAMLLLPAVFFFVLCLLAYLVTRALGTQVQREAIAELATTPHHRWRYVRLLRIAFFFALGLEAGLLLSPWIPFSLGQTLLWVSVWLFLLTFLIWLWLVFLKGATRFLLGASLTSNKGAQRLITVLSTVVLAVLLGSALISRLTIEAGYRFDRVSEIAPDGSNPVEYFVMMFLFTSLFLLAGALAFYLGLGFVTLLMATLYVFSKRVQCLRCGSSASGLLLIGRRCRGCSGPIAPWPFLGRST